MSSRRRGFGNSLWRLADLVQVDERRSSFRAKAYRNAVWSLDQLSPELEEPVEAMASVPGIGSGIISLIEEFRSTGRIERLDRLSRLYPEDLARLRRLPRITATMLRELKAELGIEDADDLAAAIEAGIVEGIRGVGVATLERWQDRLELLSSEAVPAHQASVLAEQLALHMRRHLGVEVVVAGAVRRVEEWVPSLDLVAVGEDTDPIVQFLSETAAAGASAIEAPDLVRLVLHTGLPALVSVTPPDMLGLTLLTATGPPDHAETVLQGWSGGADSEETAYAASGLPWISPPARHLPIEVAVGVIQPSDLNGDLHLHTDWSPDGRVTLLDLCSKANELGYAYVLITDHTAGLRFGGLDGQALSRQHDSIEEVRAQYPHLIVLHGAELNVDRNGDLDVDDSGLELLDMGVVGIHSYFDLDEVEQTQRLSRALAHPKVRVLAHPTGRRIGIRPAIAFDFEEVVAAAIAHNVALETNGHRDRLDLSEPLIARAVAAGALVAANSDAHRLGELGNIANSIATLQRAGVTADPVVNTWPASRFLEWVSIGSGGATNPHSGRLLRTDDDWGS